MTSKINCWEFKECGREPGGLRAEELGICPVALDGAADGIHGGLNGGRACWVVQGSLCGNRIQGNFAQKLGACLVCPFYQLVEEEEHNFLDKTDILYKMKYR